MDHYYNTTHLMGPTLINEIEQAKRQEDKILVFFQWNPNTYFTPFDIQRLVFSQSTPVTSIRRAITDLTQQGKLVKTGTMKQGPYGKPSHTWRLK